MGNKLKSTIWILAFLLWGVNSMAQPVLEKNRWTRERAAEWYAGLKWRIGANFIPSTAVNQLEMWQKDTFDPATIDKELGWAERIGFNTVRVYLHSLAWKGDEEGFKTRVNDYLGIADSHKIKTIFVFFDDCWNGDPKQGPQPAPKTGVHNSGWMQDPGININDKGAMSFLENYVKDILKYFGKDQRILMWDLYNEPGNSGKGNSSMELLKNVFTWARTINPAQPLTCGIWANLKDLNTFQAMNSDIITYHDYGNEQTHRRAIEVLYSHGRPLICTEYMARTNGSLFSTVLPLLKKENVGAINWGLVQGKTNTIYAWDTPVPDGSEPKLWFHDIFRVDGTPYKEEEVILIKKLVGN